MKRRLRLKYPYNFLYRFLVGDGCWEWKGNKNHSDRKEDNRYGILDFNGKHMNAHRVSWIIFRGDPGDLMVLHKCNNASCVRPGHLYLGTAMDNTWDAIRAGRSNMSGLTCNGSPKITKENVLEIRRRLDNGENQREIGNRFGIKQCTVSAIKYKRLWRKI